MSGHHLRSAIPKEDAMKRTAKVVGAIVAVLLIAPSVFAQGGTEGAAAGTRGWLAVAAGFGMAVAAFGCALGGAGERRVGEESRSLGGPDHLKKKKRKM